MRNLVVALATLAVFAVAAAGSSGTQSAESCLPQDCCGACCETLCK